ncbi:DeoR/GlpR family DNA-binding transcription regulator [Pseudarthrobacter sp. J75]|uniref:DeoR/GlpR family DNA-binding transcription regulator n=1 Tax=unclassified Pseudarthrobacter TaxID=2647000 RepID=UPI002E7FC859|nr:MULTISPECIES: DeoR/GlpR family DNA-binding transcription regulator [unclassified Pseudarthrobacter]MEE2521730.1 DeoR/GlpR family DNA-binding transcription regulator [Pseudarthrobacter sp. J47]MEE2527807.1 DeoR/GlpR family DNA-binding transcription regulator [Pseudarthrobacter sp. J75]MEE2569375.1 DeoR/GlpR family DNA-binding transcription regulator [Pseudarthrobacter sp. J64]
MTRTERLTAILDLLAESGQVDVEDIVTRLGVSPATARRDLDSLAKQRLLSRTRGGATTGVVSYDLPGRYNRDDHAEAKHQIAMAASALIEPGAVIGLSGGTTSTALAQVLATRPDLNTPSQRATLTVVTNAINIASQLAVRPNIKIMVTGGILNPRSYELVGPYTDIIMGKVALDIAFVGVNGIDPEFGPTITDEGEASVNALMAQRAAVSYVLADSSKVGKRSFATMAGYEFRRLITDDGMSAEDRAAFEANGTEVIVAPPVEDR